MLHDADFVQLARRESRARKRIRLLALAHFKEGKSRTAIANTLKVSRGSVNKWVATFLQHGIEGPNDKYSPGRPPTLSQAQHRQLSDFVEAHSLSEQGGRLTGADINRYIQCEFGVVYEPSHIYRILKQLGLSWISSRSRHPQQSQAVQNEFKKTTD